MSPEAAFGRPRHMPAWRSPGHRWTVLATPAQMGAPTDLAEAVEVFLNSRRAMNCTSRTVALYADILRRFQRAIGRQFLQDVTPLDIRRYLAGLLGRP